MRSGRAFLTTVVAGFAALVLPTAGCQSCAIDCEDRPPLSRTIDGTVLWIEDDVVRFLEEDRGDIEVLVYGRASALDIGSTYTVPIYERPPEDVRIEDLGVELPTANLPSGCDCGAPFITHADGSEVDTGIFPSLPLRKFGWAALAGASIAVLSWACLRFLQGEPL